MDLRLDLLTRADDGSPKADCGAFQFWEGIKIRGLSSPPAALMWTTA
ncbi:MAG: hypothetical protein H8E62_11220 [Planctomycetes bacterium]|nr:hypothetical protein [Planctomycetota bacterium]